MKKMLLIVVAAQLCLSFFVHADDEFSTDNFYAKVFGGVNFLQTNSDDGIKPNFDTGYIASGALGYHWCNGLQLEAEYAFRRNSMSNIHYFGQDFNIPGHFQSSSYMGNLLWNIPLCWNLPLWNCLLSYTRPFLGGGIGYDVQQFHASDDGFRLNQDKKGFAWQLMAGFRYALSSRSDITLEYKFHKGPLHNFFSHAIGIGLSYKFICGYSQENI